MAGYWPEITDHLSMERNTRNAILALVAAGSLWGGTVALSKLSLPWLGAGWLTVARFVVAAPVLAVVGRRGLRDALKPSVIGSGALGFGLVVILQNAGIAQTSVSHAAVIVGAVPLLVAVIGACVGDGRPQGRAWAGYAISLAGIVLVAEGGGGGATVGGDILVVASVTFSAAFIVFQPRVLAGRDAAAVTAVQFAAGGLVALPLAIGGSGMPHAPHNSGEVIAFIVLALGGTVLPFWLFAYGQSRVSASLAGVFINLEPVVGVVIGWLAFGDPAASGQLFGVGAVILGIFVSALSRPPRAIELVMRAWERGVHVHATVLAAQRPWEREGPLVWRSEPNGPRLIGSFVPDEELPVAAGASVPDRLLDS